MKDSCLQQFCRIRRKPVLWHARQRSRCLLPMLYAGSPYRQSWSNSIQHLNGQEIQLMTPYSPDDTIFTMIWVSPVIESLLYCYIAPESTHVLHCRYENPVRSPLVGGYCKFSTLVESSLIYSLVGDCVCDARPSWRCTSAAHRSYSRTALTNIASIEP